MYSLLTLAVAASFYCLVRVLSQPIPTVHGRLGLILPRGSMLWWIGVAVAQAAAMLTHNTAAVFFPLAVNLPLPGVWLYGRRRSSSLPALESPHFLRVWMQTQWLAILLLPPTATAIWTTLPYFLLIAMGIRRLALPKIRWPVQAATLLVIIEFVASDGR
jgi:hypothetical protein